MSPSKRTNFPLFFSELHAWVENVPVAVANTQAWCIDCAAPLTLVQGRRSGAWFWSHIGFSRCVNVRAIMFDTREDAEKATAVFL